jgi:hypothetical protein
MVVKLGLSRLGKNIEEHWVSEYRVQRRIFGPKRNEVTGGWRKLHTEEFHNLYPSPNKLIIRGMKSRRMRWAGI